MWMRLWEGIYKYRYVDKAMIRTIQIWWELVLIMLWYGMILICGWNYDNEEYKYVDDIMIEEYYKYTDEIMIEK